jgi:hypothetical protein
MPSLAELNNPIGSAVETIAKEKALRAAEEAGQPPPSEAELTRIVEEAERKAVFGFDYKTDKHGNPIQQGIGSPGHETINHFNSLLRYQGRQAWEKAVRDMWRQNPERATKIGLPRPARAGE